MPELPEVETIKNEMAPMVIGRTIRKVDFLWTRILLVPAITEFDKAVKNRRILALDRRGKYLMFKLDGGKVLLVHLRMTGSFLSGRESETLPRHTRAVIHLDDGTSLFFIDPRKFGKFQLAEAGISIFSDLGPEPLDSSFTAELLAHLLSARQAPIKAVLVDQSVIAGIGNMYADEALFLARIHPMKPANTLSFEEVQRLHAAIQEVLCEAIKNKGASISNYFRPSGTVGHAHQQFKVAHRKGGKCPLCGGTIERIVVRQRGTYFCPACQVYGSRRKGG